jgi:hypothetical protein
MYACPRGSGAQRVAGSGLFDTQPLAERIHGRTARLCYVLDRHPGHVRISCGGRPFGFERWKAARSCVSLGIHRAALAPERLTGTNPAAPTFLQVILWSGVVSWDRPFGQPVPLPAGRLARTLRDAGEYIRKLPQSERDTPEWRLAIQMLVDAAEDRGPVLFARMGIERAVERKPSVPTDRKTHPRPHRVP